jgi:hypothetical protein
MPEGSTGADQQTQFETWVLVANPNKVVTNVEVIYFTPKGEVAGPKFKMQPYTRVSINEADVVPGQWSVSLLVRGDQNLGVDRETLWNNRVGMASSTAVGFSPTSGFDEWCCAEGSTKGGMDTWIEILNAYTEKAIVHVAYMTKKGLVKGPQLTIPPKTRITVHVADTVPDEWDVATLVDVSGQMIYVGRSMFKINGNGIKGDGSYSDALYVKGLSDWGF